MRGILAMVAAVAMLALVPAASAGEVPVKDFARWSDLEDAKISPHGDYLAISKWLGDSFGMAVIDLKTMKFISAFKLDRDDTVDGFYWASPDRLLLPVAKQWGPLDQLYLTGELIGVNADGSGKKYLFGYRGSRQMTHLQQVDAEWGWAFLLDPLIHDPLHAVVSVWSRDAPQDHTYPFVDRIDILSGERHRTGQVPIFGASVITDQEGVPRMGAGFSSDGRCCRIMVLPAAKAQWTALDLFPRQVDLITVSRDAGSAFFTAGDTGQPTCLDEYVFATGKVQSLLCDDAVEMEALLSSKTDRPILVRRELGKPLTTVLDRNDPDALLQLSLEKAFPGQRVTVTSRTLDGNRAVVFVDSDRNPGDFYLLDHARKKMDHIMSRRRWIDPAAMQPMEPIEYQARDGLAIHGYLTAKGGLAARKLPLVVMPHGGPHGIRDYWEWDPDAELLASRGYAVLQVNYRGSGGYGWDFLHAGYRRWGTSMQDDLTDAVKWAVAQGIADPARVCIYGASYGGYAALMSAVREPDLYRCAVGHAGVYDLVTQGEDSDIAEHWLGRKYLAEAVGEDKAELLKQSPVTYVDRLKASVLIVHGTSDRRVPFSQAKELRAALDKAKKPYEWLGFPGEEHGLWKEEDRIAFYEKLLDFLDRNIGGKAGAGAH